MKSRVSEVAKPAVAPVLMPRRYAAEGNFVLALVEARTEPPTANYDLFRAQNGKIAEHWDVLSPIPPRNECKNANAPFGGLIPQGGATRRISKRALARNEHFLRRAGCPSTSVGLRQQGG